MKKTPDDYRRDLDAIDEQYQRLMAESLTPSQRLRSLKKIKSSLENYKIKSQGDNCPVHFALPKDIEMTTIKIKDSV